MADKVSYNTKVNFKEIAKKLHEVAKSFAEKKVNDLELENLAFDDSTGEFTGGGEYYVSMHKKDGSSVEENWKGKFLDMIKEYVHYFCGDEEVNYIKEDDLQPILSSDYGQQEQNQNGQQDSNKETDGNEEANNSVNETFVRTRMLNALFEAEEEEQNQNKETGEENKEIDGQQNANGICIGYNVMYDFSVNGKKDTGIQDAIKNKSKGLFGGLLADLRNITIDIGGHDVNVGRVFDPEKWKEQAGIIDIDTNTVDKNVEQAFKHDFPNNDIGVKVWGKNPLITQLNRSGKITPQIKSQIGQSDYSIVVDVSEKDPNYPEYSAKSIANTVSKALGTTQNIIDTNKVSEKDVIKIDDIEGLYKKKSAYDKEQKQQQQTNKNSTENKSVTKESEDDNKDAEVDRSKLNETITKILKEQVEKELKDQTLQYGYQDVKQFSEQSYVKNLNDSEFTNDITSNYKNVLFIITKEQEEKESVDESSDKFIKSKLLKMLFETMVCEAEQKKDYSEIVKRIFKNVFINSSNELGIKDVDVGNLKVYEKNVDISEEQVQEDDIQNKKNGWNTIDSNKKRMMLDEVKLFQDSVIQRLFGESTIMDLDSIPNRESQVKIIPKYAKDQEKPEDLTEFGEPIPYTENINIREELPEPPEIEGWEPTGEWEPNPDSIKDPKEDVIIVPHYKKKTPQKTSLKSGKGKLYVVGSVFDDKKENATDGEEKKDRGYKTDWYIIPHKRLKDLSDRPHEENTDSDGVTAAKTSNAEYKA